MKLKNVMSSEMHTVSTGATIEEAAQVMEIFGLSFLPVLWQGKAVGVITSNDIIRKVVARGLAPTETSVAAVMNSEPVVVYEDEGLEEAALAMRKHQIRHLLVLRDDGTLGGVFTLSDLAMAWAVEDTGEVLRRIAEPKTHLLETRAHGVAFAS